MRDYELTFIVRILPSDEEVNQAIDQVISYIELGDSGVVKSVDRKIFGRRRLAYQIHGQREGHYVLIKASILPDHLNELETELKLFDPVLRYLLVREEGEVKASA
jgi:small subunit ribosomal protein S6